MESLAHKPAEIRHFQERITRGHPCIITVALCGSVPRKEHNPAVPISVEEQVESAHESLEAGATLAHIHTRNADQTPSSDPEFFAKVQEGIKNTAPA